MAYETASANDTNDLLNKLRVFALANGWTVNYWGARTNPGGGAQAGSNQALSLTKGNRHWMLFSRTDSSSESNPAPRIGLYMHSNAFSASLGTDAQTVKSVNVSANNLPGPYQAYHFFTDATKTYLHVVVEVVAGRFSHFGLGFLDKTGGGDPVQYVSGLRWNFSVTFTSSESSSYHSRPFDGIQFATGQDGGTVLRADCDGIAPRFYQVNHSAGEIERAHGGPYSGGDGNYSSYLLLRSSASMTGRAALAPCLLTINRGNGAGSTQRSIVGTPHDLRWTRLDALNPSDLVTIGSDQWRVFPVIRKNGLPGIETSGVLAYAYRVVT